MRENLEVRRENREGFTLVKELLAAQALNRHEFKMKELEFERSTEERKKWLDFAPSLVNTILGSEVFPQSTEDTSLLESIADSLSEEDLMKLSSVLKPEEGTCALRPATYQTLRKTSRFMPDPSRPGAPRARACSRAST
jgi:hypothetical protein